MQERAYCDPRISMQATRQCKGCNQQSSIGGSIFLSLNRPRKHPGHQRSPTNNGIPPSTFCPPWGSIQQNPTNHGFRYTPQRPPKKSGPDCSAIFTYLAGVSTCKQEARHEAGAATRCPRLAHSCGRACRRSPASKGKTANATVHGKRGRV